MLGSQGDLEVGVLVYNLSSIAFVSEFDIVSVEPCSISSSLIDESTQRFITGDLSKSYIFQVGVDLLLEDLFLTIVTVLESIAELSLIFIKVILVVLVMIRSALVFRQEYCASYLFDSGDTGLSSIHTSAHVVGSVSISSVSCSGVIDLSDLLVEALNTFSLFTTSTLLF